MVEIIVYSFHEFLMRRFLLVLLILVLRLREFAKGTPLCSLSLSLPTIPKNYNKSAV